MKAKCSLIVAVLLSLTINKSCAMTPNDLDFWIGHWNCLSDDTLIGENNIQKILEGKVIEENFISYKEGFIGKSWSVFDTTLLVWKQTWVDNAGSYMVFTGVKMGDTISFIEDNPVTLKGQKVYRRMIFYSIQNASFEWKWQSAVDKKQWKTNWHIIYKRK